MHFFCLKSEAVITALSLTFCRMMSLSSLDSMCTVLGIVTDLTHVGVTHGAFKHALQPQWAALATRESC